jgi:predicted DNA-binding transcriptional regulator AlpA
MTTTKKRSQSSVPLLSPSETAAYLNVSEKTVKAWRRRRTGPKYILINGQLVRYRIADLDSWLDARTVGAA